jgi:Fe-S cluster biogenesis protein NfuA
VNIQIINYGDHGMKEKVQKAIDAIRPSLQADGGDVELVDVSEDGIVKVRLTGACHGCPMSQMTLKMGIEKTIKNQIPDIKEVVAV